MDSPIGVIVAYSNGYHFDNDNKWRLGSKFGVPVGCHWFISNTTTLGLQQCLATGYSIRELLHFERLFEKENRENGELKALSRLFKELGTYNNLDKKSLKKAFEAFGKKYLPMIKQTIKNRQ